MANTNQDNETASLDAQNRTRLYLTALGYKIDGNDNTLGQNLRAIRQTWQIMNGFTASDQLPPEQLTRLEQQAKAAFASDPEVRKKISLEDQNRYFSDVAVSERTMGETFQLAVHSESTNHTIKSEMQIRQTIVNNMTLELGTAEIGQNNHGPKIAEYLRSDKVSSISGKSAAPEGSAWCAGMASHVLKATIPGTIEYSVVAKDIMNQYAQKEAFYKIGSEYTPKPADIVVFHRGKQSWQGHIGFVKEILPNGSITIIEGNKRAPELTEAGIRGWQKDNPDAVREITYTPNELKKHKIIGFGNTYQMYVAAQEEKAFQMHLTSETTHSTLDLNS